MGMKIWVALLTMAFLFTVIDSIAIGADAVLFGADRVEDLQDGSVISEVKVGTSVFGQIGQAAKFFTVFIPRLIAWDYSFFNGPTEIFQIFFVFVTTAMVIISFGAQAAGTVSRFLGSRF